MKIGLKIRVGCRVEEESLIVILSLLCVKFYCELVKIRSSFMMNVVYSNCFCSDLQENDFVLE